MASIVLLLSELLGGESASVLAADRYITGGGRAGADEAGEGAGVVRGPRGAQDRGRRHVALESVFLSESSELFFFDTGDGDISFRSCKCVKGYFKKKCVKDSSINCVPALCFQFLIWRVYAATR